MNRENQYIEVVVPLSLPFATLTYLTQDKVSVGCRVVVPIGSGDKQVVGIVWAIKQEEKVNFRIDKIKHVSGVLDMIPLIGELEIRYVEWFSAYYIISLSDTLRTLAPQLFSKEMSNQSSRWSRAKLKRSRKAAAKLLENTEQSNDEEKIEQEVEQFPFDLSSIKPITLLHSKQEINLVSLVNHYLTDCSNEKGEATLLIITPTAKMCSSVANVLEQRYKIAVISSQQNSKKRARVSLDMAVGMNLDVVIGTRAALMLHYTSLVGVIILDEHSYHYRSYRAPFFSIRDAAIMLGALHKVQTLLISPYPSVESYYNAKSQVGWSYIGDSEETQINYSNFIVLERGKDMISRHAIEEIKHSITSGKQSIVMQNRRGVASYVECETCSYTPQCPNCSTSLTLHQHLLGCHYCGYSKQIELKCSECGGVMRRKGRGTQQLEAQLEELFPDANVVRFDADSISDIAKQKKNSNWDIAVGTLLVVDRVDWSNVGVAVVANVDNMLSMPNFRANEDTYRLVGRMALLSSRVGAKLIIQSSRLDYDAVNLALSCRDREFYNSEIAERRAASFPPHSRMLKVEFRGKELSKTMEIAVVIEQRLRNILNEGVSPLHQPMVERQRGEHLVNILIKILRGESVAEAKRRVCQIIDNVIGEARQRGVIISIEVDPM